MSQTWHTSSRSSYTMLLFVVFLPLNIAEMKVFHIIDQLKSWVTSKIEINSLSEKKYIDFH